MTATIDAHAVLDSLRIPSLPQSVEKIRKTLTTPDVSIAEIAAAFATDPPLAAKALKLANSVQYGMREKTTSIQRAISMLGLQTLGVVVLRSGVVSLYEGAKETEEFSLVEFWKHSILTACLCEALAVHCRRRSTDLSPQDYYTCGLLHDLGRIVLYDNLGAEYLTILRRCGRDRTEIELEESGMLGLNHADVGAMAAVMWRLPDPIPEVIRLHHCPKKSSVAGDVVTLVAFADELAEAIQRHPTHDASVIATKFPVPPPGLAAGVLVEAIAVGQQRLATSEV